MKKEKGKSWRLFYAFISTILILRTEYLRGEIPIPDNDGIFLQIFGYAIAYPALIVIAWFWGNKRIYYAISEGCTNPKNYNKYLSIGTIFFFLLMLFFVITTFIFPVSVTHHYGR